MASHGHHNENGYKGNPGFRKTGIAVNSSGRSEAQNEEEAIHLARSQKWLSNLNKREVAEAKAIAKITLPRFSWDK